MQAGLVGLPNAGKSTLFNALTKAGCLVASYPFSTIEPNIGVVELVDARLTAIVEVIKPREVVPSTMHFVDIAGLVKGASHGEGLGNQFLGHIRDVDVIAHVVRCFQNADVAHVEGSLDPVRDIEIVEAELMLADLQVITRRMERVERSLKTGEKRYKEEYAALQTLRDALEHGEPARTLQHRLPISVREQEEQFWQEIALLTAKPVVYCANVDEDDLFGEEEASRQVQAYAQAHAAGYVALCAQLESELASLDAADAEAFLVELGLEQSGLARLAAETYDKCGLITFYTVKGPQTRAWPLVAGTPAPQAAGKIHSDMERGFIRAEVIGWQELVEIGSFAKARELGRIRVEGKDYIIKDGDVVQIRFNV
ncbi:MAG TPA: redox-regulated ATPase YchF [Firmicutes bacterium]|nr:redox-regulated ATPase YchF [Bacillota bacterium]